MKLTIDDLKDYAKMGVLERHSERGKAIRKEIEERMRWMPGRWRRLIRFRFILRYSELRTATELHVEKRTVWRWTKEIAAWLEDTDKYLETMT